MRPSEIHIFGSKDWQAEQRHKRLRPSGIVKRRRRYSSSVHRIERDLHFTPKPAAEVSRITQVRP